VLLPVGGHNLKADKAFLPDLLSGTTKRHASCFFLPRWHQPFIPEWRSNMTRHQQSSVRRGIRPDVKKPILPNRQLDLRSPVESLLRDLALVLHATAAIRRDMEAEESTCSAAS
jgi:hypothetical protein